MLFFCEPGPSIIESSDAERGHLKKFQNWLLFHEVSVILTVSEGHMNGFEPLFVEWFHVKVKFLIFFELTHFLVIGDGLPRVECMNDLATLGLKKPIDKLPLHSLNFEIHMKFFDCVDHSVGWSGIHDFIDSL